MKVLIIGGGGREHALAWKALQSPRLSELYIAPGNAGTGGLRGKWGVTARNVDLKVEDAPGLTKFAREHAIDLAIIGPEAALAAGVGDALRAAGITTFGPTRAAAEIESSKAFAKDFMVRHGIPTARHAVFTELNVALEYLKRVEYEVVIKASGLASGKGVIVPENRDEAERALRGMLVDGDFGGAGLSVVIEERLEGEEVSLLAFSDGHTVRAMPPAQDRKRLLDGDAGPNTGGMGAYAPAPVCPPELVEACVRTILQPAVEGLRAEGRAFVGVLYAGLMLTADGVRVIEFNARFGDPETQVLLPLLESDLLDIAEACAQGWLAQCDVRWRNAAAACVVLAAGGYPGSYKVGDVIEGLEALEENCAAFHAGTARRGEEIVTAGGRVLGVTGWADLDEREGMSGIEQALARAYCGVQKIGFAGMQFRSDIGRRALCAAKR